MEWMKGRLTFVGMRAKGERTCRDSIRHAVVMLSLLSPILDIGKC